MEKPTENEENVVSRNKNTLIYFSGQLMALGAPVPVIIILIICEAFQFMAMGLVEPLSYKSFGIEQFEILNFLYPDSLLRANNVTEYLVPLLFVVSIFHLTIFIRSFKKFSKQQKSRLNIFVHYLFLFSTLISAPAILINLTTISCYKSSPFHQNRVCFQGFHLALSFMALFNFAWILATTLYQNFFYISRNPFLISYFTCSSNLWMLGKFLMKLAPAIFLLADPNLKFNVLYIVSLTALSAGYLVVFRFMWPYFRSHQFLEKIILRVEILTTFVLISYISLHFISKKNPQNIVFLLSWAVGLCVGSLVVSVFEEQKENLREIYNEGKFQKDDIDSIIEFFYYLIESLEKQMNENPPAALDLIKIHNLRCSVLACPCHFILMDRYKDEAGLKRKDLYKIVLCLVREVEDKYKKNTFLVILEGYVQHYCLDYQVCSVNLLSEELNPKNQFIEVIAIQSLIYSYKEQKIQLTEMIKYRQFSEELWKFQKLLKESANKCQQYWRELVQQDCEITKLWRMSKVIQENKEKIVQFLKKRLLKIYPENAYCRRLFLEMFLSIYRVPLEEVKEEFISYDKNIVEEDNLTNQINFKENSNSTVFCAVQTEKTFTFSNVSSNVQSLLGVKNQDLKGETIGSILPESLKEFHEDRLFGYFKQEDKEIRSRNATIYIQNSSEEFIECIYETKILPSLDYGLELVGFMKKVEKKKPCLFINYYSTNMKAEKMKSTFRKSSHISMGSIAQMDIYLKDILSIDGQSEKQLNIRDILPSWDIYNECYTPTEEDDESFLENVELVSSIDLKEGNALKTIKLFFEDHKVEFDFFSFDGPELQRKRSSQLEQTSIIFHERNTSILKTDPDKSAQPLYPMMRRGEDNDATSPVEKKNMREVLPKWRITIFVLIFLLFFSLILAEYLIFKQVQRQMQEDFLAVEVSSQLAEMIVVISINLHKAQVDPSLFSNFTRENQQIFEEINVGNRQLYSLIGIQLLDEKIKPSLKVIQEDGSIKTEKSSLERGLSLYQAAAQKYEKYQIQRYFDYVSANWVILYHEMSHISVISLEKLQGSLELLFIFLYLLNGFQFLLLLCIFLFLLLRILKVFGYTGLVVKKYEESLSVSKAKRYEKQCKNYSERVTAGEFLLKQINSQNMESMFDEVDDFIRESQQQKKKKFSSESDPIKQDQPENLFINEQQLEKLKHTISFQRIPSRKKLIIPLILLACAFLTFRCLITGIMDIRFQMEKEYSFRDFIDNGHILERRLMKMLHFKLTEDRNLFTATNEEIQQVLYSITVNHQLAEDFTFEGIFKTLSNTYNQEFSSIEYSVLEEEALEFQEAIHLGMLHAQQVKKKEEISEILVVVLGILSVLILVISLMKCVMQPVEDIILGCNMMDKMLGQPSN